MKIKLNIIDLFVLIVAGIMISILFLGQHWHPQEQGSSEIFVKARVYQAVEDIKNEARNQVGKKVYFNGTKEPVTLVGVSEESGKLYLTISGTGEVEDSRYILNNIALASGQKAEIHSNFKAKVIITDVSEKPFSKN